MSLFTPFEGLLGGAMIGLAADTLLLFDGQIMGASGIISSVCLSPLKTMRDASQHWKLVFLASFLSTSSFFLAPRLDAGAAANDGNQNARALSSLGLAVAGAFVGFGTKLGNGCTSGHGICGLARLSRRSFAAVMTFMTTGVLATVLTSEASRFARFTEFLRASPSSSSTATKASNVGLYLSVAALVAAAVAPFCRKKKAKNEDTEKSRDEDLKEYLAKLVPAGVSGSLFASGLYVSTMVVQSQVIGFLDVSPLISATVSTSEGKQWNPTLAFVMGGGMLVSFLGYQFVDQFRVCNVTTKALQHPLCSSSSCSGSSFGSVPTNQVIDWQLIIGAACFGIGWGTAGYCPGPAAFLAAAGETGMLTAWWPAFFVGAHLANEIKQRT